MAATQQAQGGIFLALATSTSSALIGAGQRFKRDDEQIFYISYLFGTYSVGDLFVSVVFIDSSIERSGGAYIMQLDWRRDPIWQLIGIIISIAVALITQFNDITPKIVIAVVTTVVCGWIYFGNKQLKHLFQYPVIIMMLKLLRSLLLLLLCATLFFLSVGLFFRADNLWGKIAAGTGGILAFSAMTAVYRNERPFITSVFKYAGFITGIIGIILVIVVDNPWLKIVLGVGAVLAEILSFVIFYEKEITKTSVPQKLSVSTVPGPAQRPLEPEA